MENKVSFELKNMSFAYDNSEDKKILNNLTLQIPKGKVTTLLGPNGCGKSTLFQLLTKNLSPSTGEIYFAGTPLAQIGIHEFAKKVAIVHQNNTAPADMTVEQLVAYGRIPYTKMGRSISKEKDVKMIERAMQITGVYALKDRFLQNLSGGQRQRVWIAMAIAQGTGTLLLDEPTTFLDVRYQLQILRLVKMLNERYGMTIIMVLHDINQAIHYSDNLIAISSNGEVVAQGAPSNIISAEMIKSVYGISLDIMEYQGYKVVMNT